MGQNCISMLLTHWAKPMTGNSAWYVTLAMTALKGRALANSLSVAGPAPSLQQVTDAVPALALSRNYEAGTTRAWQREGIQFSFLSSAERDPGSTFEQLNANLRRMAQAVDNTRLTAGFTGAPPRAPEEILAALPDDAVLLAVSIGEVGANANYGLHSVLAKCDGELRMFARWPSPQPHTRRIQMSPHPENVNTRSTIYSYHGFEMIRLHECLLDDPLHRVITRAGVRELEFWAESVIGKEVLEQIAKFADAGSHRHLLFWPHEALYFLPLHLLPFRDGILTDHVTVTILPSVECLFPATERACEQNRCACSRLRNRRNFTRFLRGTLPARASRTHRRPVRQLSAHRRGCHA